MASAGRILIMPKGNWVAETEYEMLDLVYHNGASWLAKKDVVGIEPTSLNTEHWQMVASEGVKVDFRETQVACEAGETSYSIDLSRYAADIVVGVIHQLGEPSNQNFSNASLFQKNNSEGIIKTDAQNNFYVKYTVFYK